MAEFVLTILGSGSALPMHGRHPSAQHLRYGQTSILIDCGEGTQERLKEAGIKSSGIHYILISHLHGDHVFGLPGLLSSYAHLKREAPLTVVGPVGLKGLLEAIFLYSELFIPYPLHIEERTPRRLGSVIALDDIEILTFPLYHRIPCNGYMIREREAMVRLRKDKVEELRLKPVQLQALRRGEDIEVRGKIYPNEVLTTGEPELMSYAYCSDTRYDRRLLKWIRGVKVLYHETTFMDDLESMASETGHSTGAEAGKMAKEAGAEWLITGHYSSRYKDVAGLVDQVRPHFEPVLEGVEGKKYDLRHLGKGFTA